MKCVSSTLFANSALRRVMIQPLRRVKKKCFDTFFFLSLREANNEATLPPSALSTALQERRGRNVECTVLAFGNLREKVDASNFQVAACMLPICDDSSLQPELLLSDNYNRICQMGAKSP